jgi:hypothetical protein
MECSRWHRKSQRPRHKLDMLIVIQASDVRSPAYDVYGTNADYIHQCLGIRLVMPAIGKPHIQNTIRMLC